MNTPDKAIVRLIKSTEIDDLLQLHKYLHEDDPELAHDQGLNQLWEEIMNDQNMYIIVVEVNEIIAASCVLASFEISPEAQGHMGLLRMS